MSHSIDVYYFPPSPPSRAVLLTAKIVGIELNLKSINIAKGEQMAPYYIKVLIYKIYNFANMKIL